MLDVGGEDEARYNREEGKKPSERFKVGDVIWVMPESAAAASSTTGEPSRIKRRSQAASTTSCSRPAPKGRS